MKYRVSDRLHVIIHELMPTPCKVIHPEHAVLSEIIRPIVTPGDLISFQFVERQREKSQEKSA